MRYAQRAETREEVAAGRAGRGARSRRRTPSSPRCPPTRSRGLLPEEWRARPPFAALARFAGSPIVSVEMWLDRVVVDRPMLGLRDSEMEWVFDKGRLYGREGAPQHLAFIVSAAYRSAPKPNAELVAAAEGALRRYFPAMAGATVERALVLRDPLATFASSPELEALRPGPDTPIAGLFLAGDWTDTGLPATIEGAVRSGQRAAQHARRSGPGVSSERPRLRCRDPAVVAPAGLRTSVARRPHGAPGGEALAAAATGHGGPSDDVSYSGRTTFGKLRQTGTPQKCSPSVQVGVMRPWRSTQGGPMWRASRGWTARTCSSSSIEAR